MLTLRRWAAALVLAALAAGVASWPVDARAQDVPDELIVRMKLYAPEGDELKYTGVRRIREQDGRVEAHTEFSRPDGTVIQVTDSAYDAETLGLISYRREDLRTGAVSAMRRVEGQVAFTTREGPEAEPERTRIEYPEGALFSQTVARHMLRHLDALRRGETIGFELLVPGRQDSYSFRFVCRNCEDGPPEPRTVVRMEPANWLVRQLVDPMRFVWERGSPPRLVEYRGRSSIRTEAGEPQSLRYEYSYEAPPQG